MQAAIRTRGRSIFIKCDLKGPIINATGGCKPTCQITDRGCSVLGRSLIDYIVSLWKHAPYRHVVKRAVTSDGFCIRIRAPRSAPPPSWYELVDTLGEQLSNDPAATVILRGRSVQSSMLELMVAMSRVHIARRSGARTRHQRPTIRLVTFSARPSVRRRRARALAIHLRSDRRAKVNGSNGRFARGHGARGVSSRGFVCAPSGRRDHRRDIIGALFVYIHSSAFRLHVAMQA